MKKKLKTKLKPSLIAELSLVLEKWGYDVHEHMPEVNYTGPRGGYEHYHTHDFFEILADDLALYQRFRWSKDE